MNLPSAIIGIVERALIKKPRFVYRSAATGRFVTAAYANANPDLTIKQRVG